MTLLSESKDAKLEPREEERELRNIALAIFRFRARRGVGVYYTLLAIVPLFVGVMDTLSAPAYFTIISVGLLILGILFLARSAGMNRFYQMRLVMSLFEQEGEKRGLALNRVFGSARTVLITLMPLVAAAIFEVTGSAILGSAILIALVIFVITYYKLLFLKHSADSVLPWRIEDWLIVVFPSTLLLLSFFQVVGTTTYLVSLLLLLLLAGLKSSYEAPQELVQVLSDKDSFRRETLKNQEVVSLSELASGGPLSNFTRVGIMLALLGVEQITFTDLMFVVKVSKSL